MHKRSNRWIPSKAGFINFWVYDEEVYDFHMGNILFRGENGQGKSVSMQSIVPILLDGNTRPSRIDPFGSSKRKIIDYLKVNDEVDKGKIAYLYLTYEKELTKESITTGIGLRAIDDTKVDFWGFIVKNEKIGSEFKLTKSAGYNKDGIEEFVPISKLDLKRQIYGNDNATFVTTQSDYADEVNKQLYKFESVELFKELTDLLIQIRSPKLSKEMRPTILYDALKNALPELPSSDFSMISNTIKDIDDRNRKIDKTQKDLGLAKQLADDFNVYQNTILKHSAYRFVEATKAMKKFEKALKKKEDDVVEQMTNHQKVKDEFEDMDIEHKTKKNKLGLLESPEIKSLNDDKTKKNSDKTRKTTDFQKKNQQLATYDTDIKKLINDVKRFGDDCYEIEKKILTDVKEARFIAEQIQFAENESYLSSVMDNLGIYRKDKSYITTWKARLKEHVVKLKQVLYLFSEENRIIDSMEAKKNDLRNNAVKVEQARKDLQESLTAIENLKAEFKTLFRDWLQANKEFKLPQDTIGELMYIVENLFEYPEMMPTNFERELNRHQDNLLEPLNTLFYSNRVEIKTLSNRMNTLTNEREKLQNETEIEPETRRNPTKEQRELLIQSQIPFVPFYESVEFVKGLSEKEMERIESAIWDMGILDALIVPSEYYDKVVDNDTILLPRELTNNTRTLDDVLEVVLPDAPITESDIRKILKSIAINDLESEVSLNMEGEYRHGLLKGKAVAQENASFIGKEARKRHREQKIKEVEQALQECDEQLKVLNQKEGEINRRKALVVSEYKKRPVLDDITNENGQKTQKQHRLDDLLETGRELQEIHDELSVVFIEIRNERIIASNFLSGAKDEETIKEITNVAEEEYRDIIDEIHGNLHTFETKKVEEENANTSLKQLYSLYDDLKYEVGGLKKEIQLLDNEIINIEERLRLLGSDKIEKEADQLRNRITELEGAMPAKLIEGNNLQNAIEKLREEIEKLTNEYAYSTEQYNARKEILENEMKESDTEVVTDLLALAKKTQNEEASISDALKNMFESVSRIRSLGLEDFSLSSKDAVSGTYQIDRGIFEEKKDMIDILYNERKRLNVTMFVQGGKKNPLEFYDYLFTQLEQQKSYLKKEEESLIKNVMIQGTGEKIRQLIVRAEQWKNDINHYMGSMNNSIDLRLIWLPIEKTDTDESLSTKRLVDLLSRDFETLKETDIELLSTHFMTKINIAKDRIHNKTKKDDAENLEQALKQVLDYRDWYQFKIMYKLPGEKEKTLNEDNLPKLSGGEKAMAIYIPLFSAAYSKYCAASEDAPYLVALDEAYAGVDENNIAEMFGFMERFGFDYILTSQALWADYPTVPGINIYELSFDKEARFVFSEPWRWNGNMLFINTESLQQHGMYIDEDGNFAGDPVQDELVLDFEFEPNR